MPWSLHLTRSSIATPLCATTLAFRLYHHHPHSTTHQGYIIRVQASSVWLVRHRFSDFTRLNQQVRSLLKDEGKAVMCMLPSLPEKKLFGNLHDTVISDRKLKLAKYLRDLVALGRSRVVVRRILEEFLDDGGRIAVAAGQGGGLEGGGGDAEGARTHSGNTNSRFASLRLDGGGGTTAIGESTLSASATRGAGGAWRQGGGAGMGVNGGGGGGDGGGGGGGDGKGESDDAPRTVPSGSFAAALGDIPSDLPIQSPIVKSGTAVTPSLRSPLLGGVIRDRTWAGKVNVVKSGYLMKRGGFRGGRKVRRGDSFEQCSMFVNVSLVSAWLLMRLWFRG